MEAAIDEICVTLQFMAEFFEKLPEDTCMELARHVRMETANKEQILARNGDEAFKFSLIITGVCRAASRHCLVQLQDPVAGMTPNTGPCD